MDIKRLDSSVDIAESLTEEDLKFIAEVKSKPSQEEIFRKYVKNHYQFSLKDRRKIMSTVQKNRAEHAKKIFMKELASLSKKLGN